MSTVAISGASSVWNSGTILIKAQRYTEEMFKCNREDWQFVFWSTLTIELLARAVLAKVSPVLLADPTDWNNLYNALGHTPNNAKYSPKSIPISDVLARLRDVHSAVFDEETRKWCSTHTGRRNAELHSGEAPFDGLKPSDWLPSFYKSCAVLMKCMDMSLSDLIGIEESKIAVKMMAAANDQAAKAVLSLVKSHQTVWTGKNNSEKVKLSQQSIIWAARHDGHVVDCPACECKSLVYGEAIATPTKVLENDMIKVTQVYLPNRFECVACQLKFSGLSQLNACDLGDTFKKTTHIDAAEYYAPEPDWSQYEEDNNEPM